jgi:hypothetical protein
LTDSEVKKNVEPSLVAIWVGERKRQSDGTGRSGHRTGTD